MSTLSTHVLDSSTGTPARGLAVRLDGAEPRTTDADGRLRWEAQVPAGDHTLTFATGAWFGERPHFHPEVTVSFTVAPEEHHHVALLLGPYSYTTYKGS
jgi:5-hydroxyisourate hydrolase